MDYSVFDLACRFFYAMKNFMLITDTFYKHNHKYVLILLRQLNVYVSRTNNVTDYGLEERGSIHKKGRISSFHHCA
jgi:hypothetical protein